jgi:hypothetical protein
MPESGEGLILFYFLFFKFDMSCHSHYYFNNSVGHVIIIIIIFLHTPFNDND